MNKLANLLCLVALAACGETAAPVADAKADPVRAVNEVLISSGTPVTMADLSIDGMTCAMGCGNTIKSALVKLPGVSGAEVGFTEAGVTNHVVVTYDPGKVSDADMVKAVQGLHNGDYKVVGVGITKQVLKSSTGDQAPTGKQAEEQVNTSIGNVALPSIVALLQRLVRI